MTSLNNLSPGDHFYLVNQFNAGEFEYLGENRAKLLKNNQIVQINGHSIVGRVVEGEILTEKLLENKK